MESSLLMWCWVFLVLVSGNHFDLCFGCAEIDRRALLEVKASMNSPNDASFLSSWEEDAQSDCCKWEGVVCSSTNGRVEELNLSGQRGRIPSAHLSPWEEYKLNVNASVFAAFDELRRLDLSENYISFSGFERLSGLKKLEFLDLSYNMLNASILPSLGTLSSLRTLNLSRNGLGDSASIWGFERLSGLKKLELLNLSWNMLNASILPSLGTLSSLRTLNLACNSLEDISELASLKRLEVLDLSGNIFEETRGVGSFPIRGFERLSGLKKLELLDLSFNWLNASILPSLGTLSSLRTLNLAYNSLEESAYSSIQVLSSLKKLEVLDLSYNQLSGAIPPSFGSLSSSLKALSLSGNQLNGSIQGLCSLQKLQELDLSANELGGGLPQCLGSLTSLGILDLSYNKFEGSFPSSIITNHTCLVFLAISYNRFEGTFSLHWFANHTKLKVINLRFDDGKLEIETEHPTWVPSFQLEAMYVSNCNLNWGYQGAAIPSFLSTQYALIEIDMSHNRLSGSFPAWLLKNNTKLEGLSLRNNSMTGPFDLPLGLNTSIQLLDISDNHINGYLPTNIGLLLPKLHSLNMSRNALHGDIPSSLGDVVGLQSLDLSNNNLTREISSNLTSIPMLRLSNNKLHGKIFMHSFDHEFFGVLVLGNNQFTEIASDGLSNRSRLEALDIGNNKLSGMLPSWIGELSKLDTLILRGNHFQGPIPNSFCQLKLMKILDISDNNLFGSMPSCFNLSQLRYLHLQGNELTGSISNGLLRSPNLATLDIRYNRLQGSLPSWIRSLSELRALLLRENNFHGPIPLDYCQLNHLNILDLSYNNLSGSIPSCFSKMSFGKIGADTAFSTDTHGFRKFSGIRVDSLLSKYSYVDLDSLVMDEKQKVEFILKSRLETYEGVVLNLMAGIDLSCNHLTGDIPTEIGNLINLLGLNLTHNHLTGPIPKSFSNLKALESLDLSHNQLSGSIPSQLIDLTFLVNFTVAYNNLSGRLPSFTAQFATFSESDYQGNPGLCGLPLKKSCTWTPHELLPKTAILVEEDELILKLATFGASYMVFLSGFVIPLYLNKNWRGRYFHAMDTYLLFPIKNCFLRVYVWIFIKVRRAWM